MVHAVKIKLSLACLTEFLKLIKARKTMGINLYKSKNTFTDILLECKEQFTQERKLEALKSSK